MDDGLVGKKTRITPSKEVENTVVQKSERRLNAAMEWRETYITEPAVS